MGFQAAMIVFGVFAASRLVDGLDRRLRYGRFLCFAFRLALLVTSVGAVIVVPTTLWQNVASLYTNLGVATFAISLVTFILIGRLLGSLASRREEVGS